MKNGSVVYEIVLSEQNNIPKDAKIKCIIKNRMVIRDATYSVFYKTDKMHSTSMHIKLISSNVEELEKYAVGIQWYCLCVIGITIIVFFTIMKKIKFEKINPQ